MAAATCAGSRTSHSTQSTPAKSGAQALLGLGAAAGHGAEGNALLLQVLHDVAPRASRGAGHEHQVAVAATGRLRWRSPDSARHAGERQASEGAPLHPRNTAMPARERNGAVKPVSICCTIFPSLRSMRAATPVHTLAASA